MSELLINVAVNINGGIFIFVLVIMSITQGILNVNIDNDGQPIQASS